MARKSRCPENKLKESLKLLNLSYIDLYLIHWPLSFCIDGKLQKMFFFMLYGQTWKNVLIRPY